MVVEYQPSRVQMSDHGSWVDVWCIGDGSTCSKWDWAAGGNLVAADDHVDTAMPTAASELSISLPSLPTPVISTEWVN
jgi:hypothetical protein